MIPYRALGGHHTLCGPRPPLSLCAFRFGKSKADTGAQATANTLFDRQAWVGLTGDFGTVYLGRTKDLIDGTLARADRRPRGFCCSFWSRAGLFRAVEA